MNKRLFSLNLSIILILLIVMQAFSCVGFAQTENIEINEANFPDDNFRNYLLTETKNGAYSVSELQNIDVSQLGIASLEGIEYLTGLVSLDCSSNFIKSLDLSKNTKLNNLQCYENELESLNLSGLSVLHTLSCNDNSLSSLDLSDCTELNSLSCWWNEISSLDISGCTKLTQLYCDNNKIASLDLKNNSNIEVLDCSNNKLTQLDISGKSALTTVECFGNEIKIMNTDNSPLIKYLHAENNKIEQIDLSDNTELLAVRLEGNGLLVINLANNTSLRYFSCNPDPFIQIKLPNTAQSWTIPHFSDEEAPEFLAGSTIGAQFESYIRSGAVCRYTYYADESNDSPYRIFLDSSVNRHRTFSPLTVFSDFEIGQRFITYKCETADYSGWVSSYDYVASAVNMKLYAEWEEYDSFTIDQYTDSFGNMYLDIWMPEAIENSVLQIVMYDETGRMVSPGSFDASSGVINSFMPAGSYSDEMQICVFWYDEYGLPLAEHVII